MAPKAKREADVPLISAEGTDFASSILSAQNENPESRELNSWCWSTITFGWLNNLIAEGYRRQVEHQRLQAQGRGASQIFEHVPSSLKESDLFELRSDDKPENLAVTIEKMWKDEQTALSPSYRRALRRSFQGPFIAGGFLKFIYDSLQFVGPYILQRLLKYLEMCAEDAQNGEACSARLGLIFVGLMLATNLLQTVVLQQYFHRCFRTGMRVNAASIGMIYSKSLRLGPPSTPTQENADGSEKKARTSGEIINLMSVDSQRLQETMTYLHVLWSGPFQIICSLVFLWFVVGLATISGVVVMVLQVPLVALLASRIRTIQQDLMTKKDERIKLTNETFSAVRLLKMYGWEGAFEDRVNEARDAELKLLRRYQIMNIVSNSMWQVAPILTGVATFGTYVWVYGDLEPATAFTALALLNVLRFPLTQFPNMITAAVEANVALNRIQSFLEADEVAERTSEPAANGLAVVVNNARLEWPSGEPLLGAVSFTVPTVPTGSQAHLTVVLGQVGTGKSGLMQALIGDLFPVEGSMDVFGSVAYSAQTAWIRNASLKENIIFTSEFNESRYKQVIADCCLAPDLAQLPNGDKTEIGERGVNLSGGQKQRVALARAIYSSASLLLLDDPLSAVDSEVAKKLLHMLRGPLVQGKSIVLCTHALSAVEYADKVIVLERDVEAGQKETAIVFNGTAVEFKVDSGAQQGSVARITSSLSGGTDRRASNAGSVLVEKTAAIGGGPKAVEKTGPAGKLVEKESEVVGAVSWKVYNIYIQAAGGTSLASCVIFGVIFGAGLQTGADVWVSFWSDHSNPEVEGVCIDGVTGVIGYTACSLIAFTGIVFTATSFRLTALKAARSFHEQLLNKLLSLPMKFHDTTPQGRILNRFSKDVYVIDETLVAVLYSYLQVLARVVATIVVIAVATPWFLAVIIPLLGIYKYTQSYYIPTSRQLKRLESNLRSPVFSHFAESLDGVTSIRAYAQQSYFMAENAQKVRQNMRAWYLNTASNRWLAVRLETLGTAIVCASGSLAVASRSTLAAGVAGLSVSYALSVTQNLNWVVRMTADRETAIVSVERVHEYISEAAEPPRNIREDPSVETWPSAGAIQFQDVVMRYRPHLPTVLNNLTLNVASQEKMGICGRTGAGKSSILNALLRIVEVESGSIFIDGKNLAQLGLHTIRHSISVIPQDPVLFSGRLQFNLDPLSLSKRDEIWKSLERAHLAEQVKAKTVDGDPLEQSVAEGGSNYSLGQRQQMCLARALLRSNRILLLDEATSAIDSETDALIQETIRTEFASHTVLCIAHRISTIMHSDRVCVLEGGEIAELDDPKRLFQDLSSRFHQLAKLDGVQ